ncbi:MAG: PaaI family thioesterase, partial [Proteobacteria bacterium]|nr:PaaI family thioesterase [Pseudomonadota bacterium]
MSGLSQIIDEARRANEPNRIMRATPYAEFLGISIEIIDGNHVCQLAFRDDHIGNPLLPALHGGVIGALLESAAIFHLVWDLNAAHIPKTINMSIDYL